MRLAVSLIVAAAAAFVAAQPTVPVLSVDPRNAHLRAPQTNAKRFAAGLPPLPPRSRHSGVSFGGSKVDAARRTVASPSPQVNTACNILVKKASNGSPLGYIKASGTGGALYGSLQSDRAASLEVSLSYQLDGAGMASQLNLPATRGINGAYPYFGATSSAAAADLNSGISTFAYITGTGQTPRGSPPTPASSLYVRASGSRGQSESAIWKYDPLTRAIAAQWVNSDGSSPPTYLAYSGSANLLYLTGDMVALQQKFPSAIEVTFTCDPTIGSPVIN